MLYCTNIKLEMFNPGFWCVLYVCYSLKLIIKMQACIHVNRAYIDR